MFIGKGFRYFNDIDQLIILLFMICKKHKPQYLLGVFSHSVCCQAIYSVGSTQ